MLGRNKSKHLYPILSLTAVLLACLISGKVQAQSPKVDPSRVLQNCYAQSEIRTEVGYCLQTELGQADARMDSAYQQALAQAKQLDKLTSHQRLAAALESSQEAFLQFREQECRLKLELAFPGTGSGDVYRSCMVTYTQWRAQSLTEQLNQG